MFFGFWELLVIIIIVVVLYFLIGPSRIAMFLDGMKNGLAGEQGAQNSNIHDGSQKKKPLRLILGLAGLIGGYFLGSFILLKLSFTSNQVHVLGSSLRAFDDLRADYSTTGIIGGIVGAILFGVIGLLAAKLLEK